MSKDLGRRQKFLPKPDTQIAKFVLRPLQKEGLDKW